GRDRARSDVHAGAHVGIAQVAEVVALRARADDAVLDLGIGAQLHATADPGALANVREGPDGHVGLDDRLLEDAGPDDRALADPGVDDLAARADDRTGCDLGGAAQHDAG